VEGMPIPNFLLVHCTYISTKSNSTGALHSKLKLDEEKSKHASLAQQMVLLSIFPGDVEAGKSRSKA